MPEKGLYRKYTEVFSEVVDQFVDRNIVLVNLDSNFQIHPLPERRKQPATPVFNESTGKYIPSDLYNYFSVNTHHELLVTVPYLRDENYRVLEVGGNFPVFLPTGDLEFTHDDDIFLYMFISRLGNNIYSQPGVFSDIFDSQEYRDIGATTQGKSIRTGIFSGILSIILVAMNISKINNRKGLGGLIQTLNENIEDINNVTKKYDFDTLTKLARYGFTTNANSIDDYMKGIEIANEFFRREEYGSGVCPITHKTYKDSNGEIINNNQSPIERLSEWTAKQLGHINIS